MRSRSTVDHDHLVLRHGDQLAGRLIGDQPAVVDDRDAVAQLLGLLQIMGGEHHRHALVVESADIVPELLAKLDIDAGGRLVEHQDRRRVDHRLGDQQPALHAARQGAGIGVGLVGRGGRAASSASVIRSALGTPYSPAWISSASRGVKKGSNNISWGTMPIDRLALRGCSSMSKPQISARAARS